jgi:ABC-2 type transport system permease protein
MTDSEIADDSPGTKRSLELAQEPLLPASPQSGFFSGTARSISDVWRYRGLLNLLLRRELKVRYKDSALGFVWTLLRPLAQLLVYAVAVGEFLGASKGHDDYPIYVFSGLTIWQLFSEIISSGTSSMMSNAGLIKKVYLPREVFPLSVVGSALVNFLPQLAILICGTLIVGKPPNPDNIVYALLAVGIVLVYGTALAFVLSAINVYLRDVQYLVEIALMWGLWTAPIVYKWSVVAPHLAQHEWVRRIYLSNPVTESVLGFQRAFWRRGTAADSIPNLGLDMSLCICIGLILLWVCQRIFARLQANFAQEL